MENINLIRKIAWSFHSSTGLDPEELFQEAAVAYFSSLEKYDPARGALSTFMYRAMTNHLGNYTARIKKRKINTCELTKFNDVSEIPDDPIDIIPEELWEIPECIFDQFEHFASLSKRRAKLALAQELRKKGWSWSQIWSGIRHLKQVFS